MYAYFIYLINAFLNIYVPHIIYILNHVHFMEIQNVTFAKKHGSLVNPGFREISSRENQ